MGTLRPSNRDSARDFLVDEIESTVIFSTTTGSIEVLSIETGELLWKLNAVRRFLDATGICGLLSGNPTERDSPGSPWRFPHISETRGKRY